MSDAQNAGLSLLGNHAPYAAQDYSADILEAFANRHPQRDYFVALNCPEFTSLCPITGQPDFADMRIRYIPDARLVESKSLKMYLFSFRNHGGFHEDCVNVILRDLLNLLDPKYIEVHGLYTPRGGIAIHPFANYARAGTRFEAMAQQRLFAHECTIRQEAQCKI